MQRARGGLFGRGRRSGICAPLGLSLMVSLSAALAPAATSEGEFAIKGIGLMTCGQFLERREQPDVVYALAGWIDGFVTALNKLAEGTFDSTPWQSADLMVRVLTTHCENNAEDRVAGVVASIVDQFAQDKMRQASPLVPVVGKQQGLLVYANVLARVQTVLAEQGLYGGEAGDGFNQATRDALGAFQKDNGLPVTGLPDTATLWLLFYPPQGSP